MKRLIKILNLNTVRTLYSTVPYCHQGTTAWLKFLDDVLQLLSSLTLLHGDAQTLIDVITDQADTAVQPAPTCTVQAATLLAAPTATVQAPTTTVQAIPLPAVQPAPTATVQTADLTTLEPALAATVSVFPAVQIHPSPIALSGFYGFPHLPLTRVIVNGNAHPLMLLALAVPLSPDAGHWMMV
ncbi:hypothetical protein EDD22DRAFT_851980 [Suillus occidentalis]|nr:hypothetical protein EDD22DRAFT_851980 [Suillus occidentalis]